MQLSREYFLFAIDAKGMSYLFHVFVKRLSSESEEVLFPVFILYFLLLRTLLEFLRENPALSFPPLFLNQRQGTPSFFQVCLSSVQTKISVEASVSLFFLASKKRRE